MKILKKNLDCVKESENFNEDIGCVHNPTSKQGWVERKRVREKERDAQGQRQKEIVNVLLTLKKKILLV